MPQEIQYPSVSTLKNLCNRPWAKASYDEPFKFNIIVNKMSEVERHVPTKYQFIGNPVYDSGITTYLSSSAPDTLVKVNAVRSTHG